MSRSDAAELPLWTVYTWDEEGSGAISLHGCFPYREDAVTYARKQPVRAEVLQLIRDDGDPTIAERVRMGLCAIDALAAAWRDDWNEFDGRVLRRQLNRVCDLLETGEKGDLDKFFERSDLCPSGHWREHCKEGCSDA